ncbi:hypothetical protein [Nonomuraea sp. SYSU D8015]|uniref:hypothetical protein n=1 Tax=Nonomuraea sp. SYSU D8015 TaxID=2593644 RepID=UPI001660C966|nr:hypothetical protein [Nonomuraea sp. SYSU D8015]
MSTTPRPPVTLDGITLDGDEQTLLNRVFAAALYRAADDHDEDLSVDIAALRRRFDHILPPFTW